MRHAPTRHATGPATGSDHVDARRFLVAMVTTVLVLTGCVGARDEGDGGDGGGTLQAAESPAAGEAGVTGDTVLAIVGDAGS
jgi:hypothetical protein